MSRYGLSSKKLALYTADALALGAAGYGLGKFCKSDFVRAFTSPPGGYSVEVANDRAHVTEDASTKPSREGNRRSSTDDGGEQIRRTMFLLQDN